MQIQDYLRYPAKFEDNQEGGFMVSFRDLPGALTEGASMQEAQKMAQALLLDYATFNFQDKKAMPTASTAKTGETYVELPMDAALKIMLRNAMLEKHYRVSDLAKKINVKPQQLNKNLELYTASRLSLLAPLFAIIGTPLKISC